MGGYTSKCEKKSKSLHPTLYVYIADGGEGYTLHVHTRLLRVLDLLHDVENSYVNDGIPRKI
jgi:hypothetical protein